VARSAATIKPALSLSPMQVGQGREPAEPGARNASLDGAATVRQRPARRRALWKCPLRAMCGSVLILLGFSEFAHCGSKNARCAKALNLPHFSLVRPGRTLRLLSCNRSVGGLGLTDPAPPFARLRSDKDSDPASWQRVACRFIAVVMPILWRSNVSPGRRKSDAGAAAVVLCVCGPIAGRRQSRRGHRIGDSVMLFSFAPQSRLSLAFAWLHAYAIRRCALLGSSTGAGMRAAQTGRDDPTVLAALQAAPACCRRPAVSRLARPKARCRSGGGMRG
jgi:hypothetical protein